jgi:hypothetical protein
MASNALRFETNIPECVALQFDDGLPVQSDYSGDQVCYTLTDGRKMYVSPYVADKIRAAGIRAYQEFSICKREVKDGNRRRIEFQVEPLAGNTPQNGTAARVSETHAAVVAARNDNPIDSRSVVPSHNSNAPERFPEPRPVAPPAAPYDGSSAVALLKMAGCGAIDAVLAIEHYAEQRGLTDFSFGVENIQKFAACLFIELNKKVGRA